MTSRVPGTEPVKPVLTKDQQSIKPKNDPGREYFPVRFNNTFLISKKKSGKTCAIYHIIDKALPNRHPVTKATSVYIFSPTATKDPTMIALQALLKTRKVPFMVYDSILDESVSGPVSRRPSHITRILGQLRTTQGTGATGAPEKKITRPQPWGCYRNFGATAADSARGGTGGAGDFFGQPMEQAVVPGAGTVRGCGGFLGKKRGKKTALPEVIFIFDDLGALLKHPSVANLVKTNRHYRSRVLISTQYPNDLRPESLKQADYFICFRSFAEKKLMEIYRHMDISVEFEEFVRLYLEATREPFSFLYADIRDGTFRKCFTDQLSTHSEESKNILNPPKEKNLKDAHQETHPRSTDPSTNPPPA
jgi:hypothetical protein